MEPVAMCHTPKNGPVFRHHRQGVTILCMLICCYLGLLLGPVRPGQCQEWTSLTIRLLPDSAFALVEVAQGGAKTRHFPHHDLNDRLDEEQLIYVLGKSKEEEWLYPHNKASARKHLSSHYDRFILRVKKEELHDKINLNTAKLTELVRLPHIGPTLAVKIIDYRDTHSRYESIRDIKRIGGIGDDTFMAIQHYVKVD